jgi:hypothetical protein
MATDDDRRAAKVPIFVFFAELRYQQLAWAGVECRQ